MNDTYFFNERNIKKRVVDKNISSTNYILYMLNRTQSMFKWDNLPDTIPQYILESYLQMNGHCVLSEVEGNLYVFTGGLGGKPDQYSRPTIYTVSNPALNFSKNYKIDEDCVLIKNDTFYQGLLPIYEKYASLMSENDITMRIASINMRLISIISAGDDRTKLAAIEYLKEVEKGNIGVVLDKSFMDETFRVLPTATGSVSNYLNQLTEYQQYLKASWFNEIGLQANYNMKREALNSSETQMDSEILLPLVEDMLRNRQEAVKNINKMFNTNIKVDFNSAWEDRISETNPNQNPDQNPNQDQNPNPDPSTEQEEKEDDNSESSE